MYERNITNVNRLEEEFINTKSDCLKRMRLLQTSVEHFWKKFFSVYLNELRQYDLYRKKNHHVPELNIDDVVLIKEDNNTPRYLWRIGRVADVVRGTDGIIRGAKLVVMTPNSKHRSIYRPVQKLVPFEVTVERSEASVDSPVASSEVSPDSSSVDSPVASSVDSHVTAPHSALADNAHMSSRRPTRRAGLIGQYKRRLQQFKKC